MAQRQNAEMRSNETDSLRISARMTAVDVLRKWAYESAHTTEGGIL